MAKKKEKKAGKRMKKKELSKAVLDFFHAKQDEVISLKYIFSELKLWLYHCHPRSHPFAW